MARHFSARHIASAPLKWLFAFAVLLQVVGAPSLVLRDAASIADPLRASQLLCAPGSAGTPIDQHKKIPAPDTRQCLAGHAGFGLAQFIGGDAGVPLPAAVTAPYDGQHSVAFVLARHTPAYAARAPPRLI